MMEDLFYSILVSIPIIMLLILMSFIILRVLYRNQFKCKRCGCLTDFRWNPPKKCEQCGSMFMEKA